MLIGLVVVIEGVKGVWTLVVMVRCLTLCVCEDRKELYHGVGELRFHESIIVANKGDGLFVLIGFLRLLELQRLNFFIKSCSKKVPIENIIGVYS